MNNSNKLDEYPDDSAAAQLCQELEQIAANWLHSYHERLKKRLLRPSSKIINDVLWGSIRLHPWEVTILDSPLIQRLRGIRQLGVIHWVYPSAGHTRFEHSVGVLHMTQALLDGIERNSGLAGDRLVLDTEVKLMRMAALVHDCGHTVMSHVSEPILDQLEGVEPLRQWLYQIYGLRKQPSTSETIAAIFVRSPAFRNLLRLPIVGADFIRDIDQGCHQIAGLLLGAPVFPEKAFLSLVINGAFDADKLDYMPRDCMMSGIPCAVDIHRLIEKIHCVSVPNEQQVQLLEGYRDWAGVTEQKATWVLALPRSSLSALNELAMTRTMLYSKVYFHQKVRALEVMVRRALQTQERDVQDWLELSDEQVIQQHHDSVRDLRERRLLKRAFFTRGPDGETSTRQEDKGWRKLRSDLKSGALAETLKDATQEACRHLKKQIALDESIYTKLLEERPPVVDEIPKSKVKLDQFAFVGDDYGDLISANPAFSSQRAEMAKLIATSGVHIFAPEALLTPAFFAAKKVLEENYSQTIQDESFTRTKLEPNELHIANTTLAEQGYLSSAASVPYLAGGFRSHQKRAVERLLISAWPRVEHLAVNFGRYQSPISPPLSPTAIAKFLRQFETEDRVRAALRMLEEVDLKDRKFFKAAIEKNVRSVLEQGEIDYICPLGKSGDSSTLLSYFISDLQADLQRPVLPLELALEKRPQNGIMLWDDFCGAGGHTKTALAQWMGTYKTSDQQFLNEDLADELNPERKDTIKQTKLFVTFALARESGIKEINSTLAKIGLPGAQVLSPHEYVPDRQRLFGNDTKPFLNEEERDELKQFLETTSRRLLAPRMKRENNPWSLEKLEERLLGYGNTSQLLVFYYNVPTVTLTPLWAGDEQWQPLFPRRGKPPAKTNEVHP